MKYLILITLLLGLNTRLLFAGNQPLYYHTTKKGGFFCYIQVNNGEAFVYKIGGYFDKAGAGYSILATDTLLEQESNIYSNTKYQLHTGGEKPRIVQKTGKKKEYLIVPTEDIEKVHTRLNNGYFLDHYFALVDTINKIYTLNHFSFRNGFYAWDSLAGKNIPHEQFRIFANNKLQQAKDSISRLQDFYTGLSARLQQRMESISYDELRDSIRLLPQVYRNQSQYFTRVVRRCSEVQPEYFFRLAEDMAQYEPVIFAGASGEKAVLEQLKAVPGHTTVKNYFFKTRRLYSPVKGK